MNDWREKILLRFSDNPTDTWTVDDAIKGSSILGGTGSGKTSASGKAIALKFLKEGWGGVVLCAKPDEALLWESYCREAGRTNDMLLFRKGAIHQSGPCTGKKMVFNPVQYEMQRKGQGAKEAQNITNIFMNIYRMGNRIAGEGDTHEERYWDTALKRCLNRTIELINLAGEELTYKNMVKVISTCGDLDETMIYDAVIKAKSNADNLEHEDEVDREQEEENYCLQCLVSACQNILNADDDSPEVNAYDLALNYFTKVIPRMGDRTRTIVSESFMGLADPFLSGLLYEHFSGVTNVFPEQTFTESKIVILDFPVKEFLDAGIMAQSIFKLLFQQAVERREHSKFPNPVFLWADEAQYFINPYDQIFLTTARSSRAATVFLSQNISNYLAVMGSSKEAKARVDSLMGNLSTKIFHANSDAETNEYASRLIGNELQLLSNVSTQQGYMNLGYSTTEGVSSQFMPQIQPKKFTVLKTGGRVNNFKVQAIVVISGREWSTGTNYFNVTFTQNFSN